MEFLQAYKAIVASLLVALLMTSGALCMFALLQGQLAVFWIALCVSGVPLAGTLYFAVRGLSE
jgi:hypothetical protein